MPCQYVLEQGCRLATAICKYLLKQLKGTKDRRRGGAGTKGAWWTTPGIGLPDAVLGDRICETLPATQSAQSGKK